MTKFPEKTSLERGNPCFPSCGCTVLLLGCSLAPAAEEAAELLLYLEPTSVHHWGINDLPNEDEQTRVGAVAWGRLPLLGRRFGGTWSAMCRTAPRCREPDAVAAFGV